MGKKKRSPETATSVGPPGLAVKDDAPPAADHAAASQDHHAIEPVAVYGYWLGIVLVASAIIADVLITAASVVVRDLLGVSWFWPSDYSTFTIVLTAFVGGATAYRSGQQLSVHIVIDKLPGRLQTVLQPVKSICVMALAVGLAVAGWQQVRASWSEQLTYLHVTSAIDFLPLLLAGILLVIFTLEELADGSWRQLAAGVGVVIALVLLLEYLPAQATSGSGLMWVAIAIGVVAFLIGVPVGFSLLAVAIIYIEVGHGYPLVTLSTTSQDGVSSYLLLAIPFFVLTGLLMGAEIAVRIGDMVRTSIGRLPGAFLDVIIVCMYLFSGISGSKAADIAAVGTPLTDVVVEAGYEREQIAAVLCASAIMGETIPPSIALLVLGSVTTVSIIGLFAAGLLPAALLGLMLMVWIGVAEVRGRKHRPATGLAASGMGVLRAFARGILPTCVPVLLLLGLILGVGTPTELSSGSVLIAVVISVLLARRGSLGRMRTSIVGAVNLSGMVLFIVAAASTFSWVLTAQNVPQSLASWLISVASTKLAFLFLVTGALLVFGLILEGLPAIVIFAPLLVPTAAQLGINPIQFSILLVLALGVGAFMPPIGVGVYVACSAVGAKIDGIFRELAPYLLVIIIGIILMILFPDITLAIPRLLNISGA
jgi:tripartite ATP-independent transporter DctM subunit